ncbi:hypothetical protein ACJIZ3_019284 [Penstemon smallii]|uniref:Uncharacterized protein n=1 Tax=Penstemon smallii TaxID=265156 RepID=A0ABD3T2A4_9LAMI
MEVSTSIRFSFVTTINITIPKFTKTRYQTTKIRCIGWPRVMLDNTEVLVEYLLDIEAQEIVFQIARLRPR